MPKIVDHDARRGEIVDAVWRVISRDGIANATTRNIAEEAGCAHGILSHYFPDKTALLRAALGTGYRRVAERVDECLARTRGLEALREVLYLTVPLTEETLVGNQVELAFLGHAVGNRELAREHRAVYARFHAIVRRLVVDARSAGEISPAGEVGAVVDALVALIDGLGMEACLFPDAFPPARQRAVIDAVLLALAGAGRRTSRERRATRKPRGRATRRSA